MKTLLPKTLCRALSAFAHALLAASAVLLLSLPALAQKATVRDGVILRDGEPYARIQSSGSVFSRHDFSFKTLDGKEFMMMHYDDAAAEYRVVFFPGEEQTRLAQRYGSASVMAQEIVDNNLVEGEAFNPAGLKRFMLAHPPAASADTRAKTTTATAKSTAPSTGGKTTATTKNKSSTSKTIRDADDEIEQAADEVSEAILNIGDAIERAFEKDSIRRAERKVQRASGSTTTTGARNRTAAVTVRGTELVQDGTVIGTSKMKSETKAGVAQRMYSIYSATDGDLVAEVTITDGRPRSAELVTPQDNRTETLELAGRTQSEQLAEIGQWLVKHRYL